MTDANRQPTGYKAQDGKDIYEGDIIEAMVRDEKITDEVWWDEGFWRFGNFDGELGDFPRLKIIGNVHDTIWPRGFAG